MTRTAGYVITIDEDAPECDADQILNALCLIRGVISIKPISGSAEVVIAREQVHGEVRGKVLQLLKELQ